MSTFLDLWIEVTEERYDEMLGMLPPAVHRACGFLVGEPMDHDANGMPRFTGFLISADGRYWESRRPITAREFYQMVPW